MKCQTGQCVTGVQADEFPVPMSDPMQKRIHTTLYKNINLQKWLQGKEAIRLRYFKENIYMMKPNSSVFKVMLDTDRNSFIPEIVNKFYYKYSDESQKAFWETTRYYYGNDVILVKVTPEADITITFTTESKFSISAKPKSAFRKGCFITNFNIDEEHIKEGQIPLAENEKYNIPDAYNTIKTKYLDKIESTLNE